MPASPAWARFPPAAGSRRKYWRRNSIGFVQVGPPAQTQQITKASLRRCLVPKPPRSWISSIGFNWPPSSPSAVNARRCRKPEASSSGPPAKAQGAERRGPTPKIFGPFRFGLVRMQDELTLLQTGPKVRIKASFHSSLAVRAF
jgi:hypothetical protein